MFNPGQWDSARHSDSSSDSLPPVSPNAGTQRVGAELMNVVNGEIVMVEGEGSMKSRAGGKRPATWMLDSNNMNMSSSSDNNNVEQQQPFSCGSSGQLLPTGSRMRLTESGTWAHSWGRAGQKFDYNNYGGEYNVSTAGMASSGQYSSPGFHRQSPPPSNMPSNMANMAPIDCSGRLESSTSVGGGMVGASSARFHGWVSSGMTTTTTPSIFTMSPMSSGASFRAATTTATTTTSSIMSRGSLSPPLCNSSKGLSSSPIIPSGNCLIGHGGSGAGQHLVRHHHRIQRKFSDISFDQEMANYESQVAQTASDNIMRLLPSRSMSWSEERIMEQEGAKPSSKLAETRSGSNDLSLAPLAVPPSPKGKRPGAGGRSGSTGKGLLATRALGSPSVGEESNLGSETSSVSTQSLQNPGSVKKDDGNLVFLILSGDEGEGKDNEAKISHMVGSTLTNHQTACCLKVFTWVEPLKFLLRKGLTVSDVGELGRVILPKKDAECHLPQMDNKEGIVLTMVDYDCTRQWVFRYKWWLNNKSRMFVLENTGDFMRYHDLKEKDAMTLYADGVGTMVICGEKIRDTFTTQQISSVGIALMRDSTENLTCSVKPNNLPAAITPEILRLTKRLSINPMVNTSPRHEDFPSAAPGNATDQWQIPHLTTDELLNDPDPTLNCDFGNTSA